MFLLLHKIKKELEKKAHSLRNQNWLSDVHDYDVFMEWYDALNRLFSIFIIVIIHTITIK